MATLMESKITYGPELRPCWVDGKHRAIFHGWAAGKDSNYTANCITFTTTIEALVEYESGTVERVEAGRVRFIDTQEHMDGIAWPEPEEG